MSPTDTTAAHRRTVAARLVAATGIGIATGLVVLALEHAVEDVIHELVEADVWVPAVVLVAGAVVTAIIIRYVGGRSSASTEVYVEEFHRDDAELDPKHAPGRLLGSYMTPATASNNSKGRRLSSALSAPIGTGTVHEPGENPEGAPKQ